MSLFKKILGVLNPTSGIILNAATSAGAAVTAKEKEALANVRKLFPGPGSCPTGTEKLAVYLGAAKWNRDAICKGSCDYVTNALYDLQNALNDWHIPRGENDYIKAYNIVIGEYRNYYLANCVTAPKTGDPVLDTAVVPPAGTGGSTGTAGNTGVTGGTPPTTGNQQPVANGQPVTTDAKQFIKGVPNWALAAGGGLLLLTLIIVVVKK